MQVYRVDLTKWVVDRYRWVDLLGLIDELPSACRLQEAIFNDPEQAALMVADEAAREQAELLAYVHGQVTDAGEVDQDTPGPLWRPRVRDWDTAAIQRAAIHAQLVHLNHNTVRAGGGKAGSPQYLPAPRTLVDDLRDERDRAEYADSLAMVSAHPA